MRRWLLLTIGVMTLAGPAVWWWWRAAAPAPGGHEYLRVVARRDRATGAVTADRPRRLRTTVTPLTGPGGYYLVLDGPTGVLAATPFSFDAEWVEDVWAGDVAVQRVGVADHPATAVYVRHDPAATTLRILDARGATVASAPIELVETVAGGTSGATSGSLTSALGQPVHAATLPELQAAYPHIRFVTNVGELAGDLAESIESVVPIDATMATVLWEALAGLNSTLGGSIGSVAMVRMPNGGVSEVAPCGGQMIKGITHGKTLGNQLILNVSDRVDGQLVPVGADQLRDTLTHEAAHAFTNLVDRPNVPAETLPNEVRVLVDQVRENLGNYYGVLQTTWAGMQASARLAYSRYGDYEGANAFCAYPTTSDAVAAGFVKPYGSTNVREDLATFVESLRTETPDALLVCQQFSTLTREVPRDRLLPFAKLNFLRGLGLIDEASYEACVRDADPADHNGFHLGTAEFDDQLKAGAVDDAGGPAKGPAERFFLLGNSFSERALLQVIARPPFYAPVGFHRLDDTAAWVTPYLRGGLTRRNLLTVQAIDAPTKGALSRSTRLSDGGFALVVSNLPNYTKAYAFYVPMEDWLGKRRATLDIVWFQWER